MYLKHIVLSVLVFGVVVAGGGLLASRNMDHPAVAQPSGVLSRFTKIPKIEDASHRAIYSFKMIAVESGAGISGIEGQMFYQQQDTCDAVTTQHRFTAEYQYPERPPLRNTSQYTSWESKDGKGFYFNSDRQENGELVEQLRGGVNEKADGTVVADYSRPPGLTYALPKGFLLPLAHTHALIEKARAGEHFFSATLFDGTDGDGPTDVSAFIGAKLTKDEIQAIAARNPKISPDLLSQDAWHIRLAVFPLKDEKEMLPSYEMDMVQHDNGVVSAVTVDYRVFKVEQVLTALEKMPDQNCPNASNVKG